MTNYPKNTQPSLANGFPMMPNTGSNNQPMNNSQMGNNSGAQLMNASQLMNAAQMMNHAQPMMNPNQPMTNQPMMNPNQPMMNPNQPMMNPNQPMMNPNQPIEELVLSDFRGPKTTTDVSQINQNIQKLHTKKRTGSDNNNQPNTQQVTQSQPNQQQSNQHSKHQPNPHQPNPHQQHHPQQDIRNRTNYPVMIPHPPMQIPPAQPKKKNTAIIQYLIIPLLIVALFVALVHPKTSAMLNKYIPPMTDMKGYCIRGVILAIAYLVVQLVANF